MCGIAGTFDTDGRRPPSEQLLKDMGDALLHRGPDESGMHKEPGVGLVHRRLSIIDLKSGQQPLTNEDGSVVVVYNGEIYNFQELSRLLVDAGHVFKTHSDTEVVVHAWEEWGEACVERFRGMFAFALWDRNQQTLFLARDRLGIKPLYYAVCDNGELVFGSELKALLRHPHLRRELDVQAVEDYFCYGYVPDPKTILKNVHKLAPGHTLVLKKNAPLGVPRRYWDVPFGDEITQSVEQAGEELLERLSEAVRIRLISEVPLGAFLSGGVDSSAVVGLMAALSDEPVNTCSIAFDNSKFDESVYAEEVAGLFHTNHRVNQVDANDFDLVDKLSSIYDEPYADSSAIPTYRVCELARKSVTVALSGDGGDELLGGYRRHRWHVLEEQARSMLPLALRKPVFGTLSRLYPKADWAPRVFRAKTTLEALARDSVGAYCHTVSVISGLERHRLYSGDFKRNLAGYNAVEVLRNHAATAPKVTPLSLVQYLDLKTYLPGDILTKVDRASMANSLEVRVPILDHEFLGWATRLPDRYKLRGQQGKFVFKRALENMLPKTILYRDKMGFSVPLSSWFRGPLKGHLEDRILGGQLADTGLFDEQHLRRMLTEHGSGRRDFSAPLWSLLMFQASHRNIFNATMGIRTAPAA